MGEVFLADDTQLSRRVGDSQPGCGSTKARVSEPPPGPYNGRLPSRGAISSPGARWPDGLDFVDGRAGRIPDFPEQCVGKDGL